MSEHTAADDARGLLRVELVESRYDRQQRVTWWDQRLLADARVLVVGAGALGNEVVKNLAMVGVGHIVVADMDTVEASNLARCVFFRLSDEGRPKAEVLAERAGEVNPDVTVTALIGDARSLGSGIARRADVLVGALDNRETRVYLNRLAARARRPWVDGAIEGLHGVARVFNPPDSCYECTLTDADWQALAHRQSCRLLSHEDLVSGKVPTTASTSSVIAGIQSQEVVKLLHADIPGVHPLNGGIVFDGANNDTYPVTYPIVEDCVAHYHYDSPLLLDGTRWETVSFADVAELAWPAASSDGVVVELGDDHVFGWRCPGCGGEEADGRPAVLVAFGEALCPVCGEARIPELTSSVRVPGPNAGELLSRLGVRPDEVLVVRSGFDERYVWVSLPDPRLPGGWSAQRGSFSKDLPRRGNRARKQ